MSENKARVTACELAIKYLHDGLFDLETVLSVQGVDDVAQVKEAYQEIIADLQSTMKLWGRYANN